MTVKINKPALNLREELDELNKPSGITGESLLRADTDADARATLGIDNFEQVSVSTDGVISADGLTSSGNLLVGKTSPSSATVGFQAGQDGFIAATRASAQPLVLNRTTNDGIIADFRKNGTTIGSIGNNGSGLYIDSVATGYLGHNGTRMFNWDGSQFYPQADGSRNLGHGSFRWNNIYATNATIITSDRDEKQDIAELSDLEQRVALACKGLLRKFRLKDSVAEKGDDARIHFGIIAQDLQAAFEAEGLDAGDYGMFISTTWTDEETNEEKTRMGVRYSELLAFIIAAL